MERIIPASQVRIGDSVRFCLRGYFFNDDPKWREHCEQVLKVKEIGASHTEGKLEFVFDDESGSYRDIDPNTEVILVQRSSSEVIGEEFKDRVIKLLDKRLGIVDRDQSNSIITAVVVPEELRGIKESYLGI